MSNILEVKDKIQRWLVEYDIHGIEVTGSGGYSFRVGSTHIFINFETRGEGDDAFSLVHITAPFLQHVQGTPELFEWVATSSDNWLFGHLGMTKLDDGTYIVLLTHVLLADYLDPEEFRHATFAVAGTADNIDDEIALRFGGETFHTDD